MKFAGSLVLVLVLVTTSVFTTGMANGCPPCPCGGGGRWPPLPPGTNTTHEPKTVVVGESEHWHFGFDYAIWAFNYSKNNPFYVGDTLVFKYTTEHTHSVVLLPDYQSYQSCNVTGAKLLGGPGDGVKGVEFKLEANNPNVGALFYFACGEGNGFHCDTGKMKFPLWAWPRR